MTPIRIKLTVVTLLYTLFVQGQEMVSTYKIYSVAKGTEVSLDEIAAQMHNYDVLIFGEEHNDSVAHDLQISLFKKATEMYPSQFALSLEMFDRDVQGIMDEYLADIIRERNFTKEARIWSNYKDYRPMVEWAKVKKLDVICANAPGRYSNLAGRKGQDALKTLTKEAKRAFAPLPYKKAEGKYYQKLMNLMGHPPATDSLVATMPAMSMGGFDLIMAQSLWDATMAYSIAQYLKKNTSKKVFHVNGRFHSDEHLAVVEQLKHYHKKAKVLVISCSSHESFPKITWPEHQHLGDFIIITDATLPRSYE